jgi:predicted dehydrogenase
MARVGTVAGNMAQQRDGAQSTDWAHVVLDYGAHRAILHASALVAGGAVRFAVHGKTGSLVKRQVDVQESQLLAGLRPGAAGWGADPDPALWYAADGTVAEMPAPDGDHRHYYAAVRDAIRGERANPVPPVQAVAVMALMDAAVESAATGRRLAPALSEAEVRQWGESIKG